MTIRPIPTLALTALLAGALPALAQIEGGTVSHGISAFGELKYPPDFAHFDYVNPDAPQGGTMSFIGTLASQTFDSLNPFILKGESAQGLEKTHDALMARALDEPDAMYGLIAESVELPEDRSWAIFTLRPEARFSDGEPITADDVVFTFETLKAEGLPYYRIALEDVATVEALDDTHVKFTFAEGVATRDLPMTVGEIPILPAHYYTDVPFADSTLDPPVHSGPYDVSRVQPGRAITYCRNPDYWAADLPANVGALNFDCFRYEYFVDRTAGFEAFKTGAYLFQEENTSSSWATAYDFPALQKGWVIKDEIPDGRPSGAQGFYFNLREDRFADPRVREAIGMLFNFEWSNETLFYGLYDRTDSFFEGSDLEATGMAEGDELAFLERWRGQVPDAVFDEPAYSPPVSSASQQVDRRVLREAGALLDEAGWEVADDGLRRNAAGETLKLEILDDSPAFERIILPYVANLRRLGVDASHNLVDPAQMQERQEVFDYDMTPGRLVLPLTPSVELRTIFGSQGANAPGALNLSGIADPAVDEIIGEILRSEDRETLTTRVRALDRVLRAMQIWVPNWNKGTHWIAYWDVFGQPDVKPDYDRGTDFWWWDEEKAARLREAGGLR